MADDTALQTDETVKKNIKKIANDKKRCGEYPPIHWIHIWLTEYHTPAMTSLPYSHQATVP